MLKLPGISAPTGFFDPAGFTSSNVFTISEAKRFREAGARPASAYRVAPS
jgi:hypothetical protein